MKKSEPIIGCEIDAKESIINHYKPEKINGEFNDKYIDYKKVMKIHQSNSILKRLYHIWVI